MQYDMRVVRFLKTTAELEIDKNTVADFICVGQFDMMHIESLGVLTEKPLLAIQTDRDEMGESDFQYAENHIYSLYLLKPLTQAENAALCEFWDQKKTYTVVTRIHCEYTHEYVVVPEGNTEGLDTAIKWKLPFSVLLKRYCKEQTQENARTQYKKTDAQIISFQSVINQEGSEREEVQCVLYDSLELGDTVAVLKSNSITAVLEVIHCLSKYECVRDTYTYCGIRREILQNNSLDISQCVPSNAELGHVSLRFSVRDVENADFFLTRLELELKELMLEVMPQFYVTGTADRAIYYGMCKEQWLLQIMRCMTQHGDDIHQCFNDVITSIGIKYLEKSTANSIVPVKKTNIEEDIATFKKTAEWLRADMIACKKIDWRFTLLKLMGALETMHQNYVMDDLACLLVPGVGAFLERLNYIRDINGGDIPKEYTNDILSILRYWASMSSDISQLESQLTQHPEFHAVRYYIPAMVLRFELKLMEFCCEALSNDNSKQRYIPMPIPEDISDLRTLCPLDPKKEVYEASTPLLVMIPYKDLYHPWETALRVTHEMAHYCEDLGRCRYKRHECLVKCMAQYIVKFWYRIYVKDCSREGNRNYSNSAKYIENLYNTMKELTSPFDKNSIWYMEDTFYALISASEKVLLKDRYMEEYLFDVDSEYFFKNGTDYKQLHRKIQYPQLCRAQTEQIAVHLELLTSLCRECYADLAMALLTDCTFDEYYTCVYQDAYTGIYELCNQEDDLLEESGVMQQVIRMALVIRVMKQMQETNSSWKLESIRNADAYSDRLVRIAVQIVKESEKTDKIIHLAVEDKVIAGFASFDDFQNIYTYLQGCAITLAKEMLQPGENRFGSVESVREGISYVKKSEFNWGGVQRFLLRKTKK